MKKLLFVLPMILLSACASDRRNSVDALTIEPETIEARPMEASIAVGKKVTGKASCSNFLFFSNYPETQTFGATLQNPEGNYSPICTRGAVYDALKNGDADLLIAPKYDQKGKTFLCLPFINACLYSTTTVQVTGFEGRYTNIKEINDDVIKERRAEKAKKAKKVKNKEKSLLKIF